MVFVVLEVSLAIFLALCANEIFGQPPLMASTGQPPAEVVGTWYANLTTVSGRPLPMKSRSCSLSVPTDPYRVLLATRS